MKRLLLALLIVLIALPLGAFVAAHFLLDADAVRARVADAVRRASGRELVIAGPIRLAWSLTPAIEARDVSLMNPPGMSRLATVHVDRVEAEVALLPLLTRRLELRRVLVAGPDILLERDAEGRPNWLLSRPEPPPSPQPAAAPSTEQRFQLVIGEVEVRDAHLSWRGGGPAIDVAAPRLVRAGDSGHLDGELVVNGVDLAVGGTAGPFASGPWPLNLNLVGGGAAATVTGSTAQAAVTVLAPNLAGLSPFVRRSLPPITDVKLAATLSGAGLGGFTLQTGPAEFGNGVRLVRSNVSAPSAGAPVEAAGEIRVKELPVALAANAASLQALFGRGPIPVQALATTGDATVSVQGTVADLRGDGPELSVVAKAADLARLGRLAGVRIPSLREVSLDLRVASSAGGMLLRGIRFNSDQGDLSGDLAIGLAGRPSLRGSLVSQRLALDGWSIPPPPAPALVAAPPAAPE
ncbi:MAG: AsmA family protein, partial [Acetobacteraceae bacterium]|nr:AsmA family protein [Acetobacteraceae bacterium]